MRARLLVLRVALITFALIAGVTGLSLVASPASADTAPTGGLPATVSADALPTWQINGVVWSQVVVGNTVYVTGSFTKARPPGVAAGGAGEVTANNIFAYDITTGNRVAGFNHSLNGQGIVLSKSPDGSRIYLGGDFTTVDGIAHNHIAAFDTATGALVSSFSPSVSARVAGIAVSPTTVYAGGNFFNAGKARTRLAAFNPSNGALLPWAPTADDNSVAAMVMAPDYSRVIVGGSFSTLNGQPANASGSLDATTGANMPWAINTVFNNSGTGGGVSSLRSDGTQIYGSGFAFRAGNFEGTFAADPYTGAVKWINDCHGDTLDVAPIGNVLYSVSHAHSCQWIGSYANSDPWQINMHHALAFTTYPTGTNTGPDDYGWNYGGLPDSTLLDWFPVLKIGSFTGQNQAAWAVQATSNYVVLGGEFPTVNGTAQQGLTRFAVSSIAPNKTVPLKCNAAPAPSAKSFSAGTARISWQAAYDMDNEHLTYNLYRSGTAAPIYTVAQDSLFWKCPSMGYVDTGLTPGATYTYTIKATDPFNNTYQLPKTNAVTISNATLSAYANDVFNDGAANYWRLGEPSGTAVNDSAGFGDATAQSGVTRGAAGAIGNDSDTASTFDGSSSGYAATNSTQDATPDFSIESWVKTTTKRGGKIVGYGNSATGTSSSYDRHVYMDNAGHIIFGVYNNNTYTITSPKTYNDGSWHQIVATLSSSTGMTLYIDGTKIGTNSGTKIGQPYTGYWRIGGDNLNGWPNQPSSAFFNGSIDDVSLYPTSLSLARVQQHYLDSGRTLNLPQAPADNYGKAVFNSGPDLYWRLDDSGGSTAKDRSTNLSDGVYSGGVTLNQPGGVAGTSNTSALFNGSNGTVGSVNQYAGPSVYSEELWFKTSTTHGGKLIGFGDQQSGNSGNYDRHVYMENSGQLTFGVWTGFTNTATSPQSYNDNKWHYMVATQGSDGMHLYVDGLEVATNPQTDQQPYTGYWRVGGDSDWGGDSPYFNGWIDEAAVYSTELTPATVKAHFVAGGGTVTNQPPVASFTDSEAGLKASFDGSGSSDPDGSIASYAWDFGDGSSSTNATPNHTYGATGDYTVALTVTDNQGGTNTTSRSIHVTNTPPNAAFTSSSSGLTASVDGSTSSDPDGSIASYDWDWGDGTSHGSGASPSHPYGAAGKYTVTLTVTDNAGGTATTSHDVTVTSGVPHFDHIVMLIEENHSQGEIVGSPDAPYISSLAAGGANFTQSFAVAHPSQPNYLALFSGDTQGVTDDSCPQSFATANLADQLSAAGETFKGYSESMPSVGYTGCTSGTYVRKHNPMVNWGSVPAAANQPFSAFPSDFSQLPDVSYVIPNLDNDMHNGTVAQGDAWVENHLGDYVDWAKTHNSLLILTFDEDDNTATNKIPTIFAGAGVVPGNYSQTIDHYRVLKTVEASLNLPGLGNAASANPITNIWTSGPDQAPTAAFDSSCTGLACSFDAHTSADNDGSVAAYSWRFGDGTSGSGVAPSHTYAGAGTYSVTLTVTDDDGVSTSVTHDVNPAVQQGPTLLASDDFSRSVTGGWGNADLGGAWTRSGTASNFAVANGVGTITMPTAPSGPSMSLNSVSTVNSDVRVSVSPPAMPTGSGVFVSVLGRTVASVGSYRSVLVLKANGTVTLGVTRVDGAGTARVTPQQTISGLTFAAGDKLDVRMVVTGTSPTSVTAKVWKDGTPEPGAWQVSGTDSSGPMQAAGAVGLMSYLSADATTVPAVTRFDDFRVYQAGP